ncbi:hypothetical protein, partial [Mesorhizobium sp.]|uniref:hypothetical protein n=1 Tax=Mesorhizobium sp. TaxID=1871066 RepID=UPI0025BD9AE2
ADLEANFFVASGAPPSFVAVYSRHLIELSTALIALFSISRRDICGGKNGELAWFIFGRRSTDNQSRR